MGRSLVEVLCCSNPHSIPKMSLFIYHENKLYADTRKVVNFPNGEIIVPCIESKVVTRPYCYVGMAGIPHAADFYTDYVTALEALTALDKNILRMQDNALVSVNGELTGLRHKLIAKVTLLLASIDKFKELPFMAVTKRNVWVKSNDAPNVYLFDEASEVAAMGSGELFAKITLMNNVHPSLIYPRLRSVGIPVGEQFEVFDRAGLCDAEPPFLYRKVWAYIIAVLSRAFDKKGENAELLMDMYYLGLLLASPKYGAKLDARRFKIIDRFALDYANDKKFRNSKPYKRLTEFVNKEMKGK